MEKRMEYQHNIVECDVCELKDHLESMTEINGKYICGTCLEGFKTIKNILNIRWHKTSEELPEDGDECLCKIMGDPDPEFPSILHVVLTYKEYSCDNEYPWYDKINDTNYKQEYVGLWISLRDIEILVV